MYKKVFRSLKGTTSRNLKTKFSPALIQDSENKRNILRSRRVLVAKLSQLHVDNFLNNEASIAVDDRAGFSHFQPYQIKKKILIILWFF